MIKYTRSIAVLALVATAGFAVWSTRIVEQDGHHEGGAESIFLSMGRGIMGPLAAIPDPLDDRQLRDIERRLGSIFRNKKLGNNSSHYPVLFVPGLFGTQLETKLNHREKPHWWLPSWSFICPTTTQSYQRSWMLKTTFWNMLPYVFDCYVEELLVRFNFTDDGDAVALPWRTGIDTRIKTTFKSVTMVDDDIKFFQYYADWLTQYLGYKANEQMIGIPWDWRLGPESWMKPGREYEILKTSIEQVVEKNEGRGIVALSISAGGPFLALFLNQHVDQAWKDKYFHAWVNVSPALSGSAIAPMQTISLQHNSFFPSNIPAYISKGFGRIVSSTSSVSWLFPSPDSYHDAVISTPTKSYHADELGEALTDAGYPQQAKLYSKNRQYFGGSNLVPGVQTYCLSGFGIGTISGLRYNTTDMSDAPALEYGDGDNCITVEALRQCDAWASQQEQVIEVGHYYNASHAGLFYDPRVIEKFFEVVVGEEHAEEEAKVARN